MQTFPPSLFNAFHICPRQAWLMRRQLCGDQQNDFVEIGRLINKDSFEREKKQIYLAEFEAVIDMVTKKDGEYFIAEVKKSSKTLESAKWQLKYYLYLLKLKNIKMKGMIKVPREKLSVTVELTSDDEKKIESDQVLLAEVLDRESPPPAVRLRLCPKCNHSDFCWA